MNYRKLILGMMVFGLALSQEVFEGYTLFSSQPNPGQGATVRLIDNDLNDINTWAVNYTAALNPYLRPDSTVLYPYRVPSPTMDNGGVGGGFLLMDWDGNTIWSFTLSNDSYQHHHDVELLPNGNFLAIAWEKKTAEEAFAAGRLTLDNPLNEMWSEAIFEFQPVGSNQAVVVWEWHLWDHLIQDVNPSLPSYGIIPEHPELMNINFGSAGSYQPQPNGDWGHFNCISYNHELDQILITSRHFSEVYIIDHSTSVLEAAGHEGGSAGMGGDFLYRWGNPQAYNRGTGIDQQLFGPHGGSWVLDGYPGEGNLLVFNNNYAWQNSAVFEFTLPSDGSGNYLIEGDDAFGPAGPIWIYTNSFYSPTQSGAFRLPNGNTIITAAVAHRIMEVAPGNMVVWQYNQGNRSIPRAVKYGLDYLAPEQEILMGDVNEDQILDVLDIVYIVGIVLGSNPEHPAADMNSDGTVDVLDIILLVNIIVGNA